MQLENFISWYNHLSPTNLDDIEKFYTEDCYFKDPFHELHTRHDLIKLYQKMFKILPDSKFVITKTFKNTENEMVLFWDYHFTMLNKKHIISGNTFFELKNGKISKHIDYWDSVNEFWSKIPVIKYFFLLLNRFMK